ncbi:MAG: serine/threonine-protein kinase [Spirulinaceae cyanobacterium]
MICASSASTLKDGKYCLTDSIGQGIFSNTYQGIEQKSKQPVIVKTLAKNLVTHPDFEQFKSKFLQLAQKFSTCRHENLVSVLDIFEEKGKPYLVYERIIGPNLAAFIEQTGNLNPTKAVQYIRQISSAVAILHHANLQHLDIKPQNIIVQNKTGKAILVDYGLTCQLTPEIRQTHGNLVSPGYAPIEHYLPEISPNAATDIYSLAATLFYLITAKEPTAAPLRANQAVPEELRQPFGSGTLSQKLNPNLKKAIVQGLAIEAKERPQTIQNWLELLPKEKAQITSSFKSDQKSTTFTKSPQLNKSKKAKVKHSKKSHQPYPFKALMMTSIVAAFIGLGFGLAIRLNRPGKPGSTIFHTEQSFPERPDWQIKDSPD